MNQGDRTHMHGFDAQPPPPWVLRWIGLVGIGFAISATAAWLIAPIAMPHAAAAVEAHYIANRTQLIVASILILAGNAVAAAWYVALATVVATSRLGVTLGRIGVVGMAIQIAVVSVGFTVFASVAYRGADAATAQLLTDVAWLLISLAGGPVTTAAVLAFGFALSRQGIGRTWMVPFSILVAIAHLVVASSFAREGFFSPVGGVEIVVPLIYQAWIAGVGIALLRAAR